MSEAVLLQIGKEVRVSGFPWEPDGYSKIRNVGTLRSPVLCERHNSSLQSVDKYAGLAFEAITNAVTHATKNSASRRSAIYLASGDALERWAAKILLGVFNAGIASAERKPMWQDFSVDASGIGNFMLGIADASIPLGMYISEPTGEELGDKVQMAPMYEPVLKRVQGLSLYLRGLRMEILLDGTVVDPKYWRDSSRYRPRIVDFVGPDRTGRLLVSWKKDRERGRRIALTLARSKRATGIQ